MVRKHCLSPASKCLKIRQHWSMGKTKLIPARDRRCQREKEAIRSGREIYAGWSSFIKTNASRHRGQSFLNSVPNACESNGQAFLQNNAIVQMFKIYLDSSQLPQISDTLLSNIFYCSTFKVCLILYIFTKIKREEKF